MESGSVITEHLKDARKLTPLQYKSLLQNNDLRDNVFLQEEARKAALGSFGNKIFTRGLIEISNHCRNDCLYCGIRAGNKNVSRYRLTDEEIMDCCSKGYGLGFRTFVLQGGEDPHQTDEWIEKLVSTIRKGFPDCAITLSLGEKPTEAYCRFKKAGADRYLLRHETFNAEHYARLHPAGMSRENRLSCLRALKDAGYQTGTGIMVGSPFQTIDNLVEDLMFIQEFKPEMVGIGPFVHHPDTPLGSCPDGCVGMTLKLISILRLMNPKALIPATTALATLEPDGRKKGILAGANVVMPNLSPVGIRKKYSLYADKLATGAESAEGLDKLNEELNSIGYETVVSRGDYKNS